MVLRCLCSYINNCSLTAIPTQLVSGDSVTSLYVHGSLIYRRRWCLLDSSMFRNLQNNSITKIPTDFQSQSFPTLVALYAPVRLAAISGDRR
jgi:hypothetical protein